MYAKDCILDIVTDEVLVNSVFHSTDFKSFIAIAQLPGVTDDEGISAQMAWVDYFNKEADVNTQHIFSQKVFYFEHHLSEDELQKIASRLLGNPLINRFSMGYSNDAGEFNWQPYMPKVVMKADDTVNLIDIDLSDDKLVQLSKEMVLALNLQEMKAIVDHYNDPAIVSDRASKGLSKKPTDCEMEILGQTWSEHCKHKEFNAIIHYNNKETGKEETINSLFKTFIKGTTSVVQSSLEENQNDWLVKVFSDNAGVVKATKDRLFVWKVETHNSPSALDPYGEQSRVF